MPPSLLWTEASALDQLFANAGFVGTAPSPGTDAPQATGRATVAMQPQPSQPQPQALPQRNSTRTARLQGLQPSASTAGRVLQDQEPLPPATLPAEFAGKTHQERLELFVTWLAEQTNADTVFLADEEGLPLASFRASDEDAAFAALLHQHVSEGYQWLSSSEQPLHLSLETVTLRIDHMFYLILMWARGFEQNIVLGLSVPYRPELKMLQAIQSTLYAIVREPGSKE